MTNYAGQRVSLSVRIATDSKGRERAVTVGEARYAILRDFAGQEFSARIPDLHLSVYRHAKVTATVKHVGIDGIVYLKNVRACKK